ncbi:MAG TPA: hypothetical protein VMV89_01360 [Candidatus Paceibacterota bacterium]|nr:hypothetical protein [Candidatus Paceibacterota bacterium]
MMLVAEQAFQTHREKQRHFGDGQDAAATWNRERRVIVKADTRPKGAKYHRRWAAVEAWWVLPRHVEKQRGQGGSCPRPEKTAVSITHPPKTPSNLLQKSPARRYEKIGLK